MMPAVNTDPSGKNFNPKTKANNNKTVTKSGNKNHRLANAKLPSPKHRIFKVYYWISVLQDWHVMGIGAKWIITET